jgi:hypothetical protein
MSRGAIEDIAVDGLWAKDGYTAVRLLSAGSPIRRIHLANIFGTFRYNAVSFTNHEVHPGSASTFEDVSITGLFCSKSGLGMTFDATQPGGSSGSLIWMDTPAVVSGLTIADLHRTESVWPTATIFVEAGATVKNFQLAQASLSNQTPGPLDLLVNQGTIEQLSLSQVRLESSAGPVRGAVLRNQGTISDRTFQQVSTLNTSLETTGQPGN